MSCTVWLDETQLEIGDNMRTKIDLGLQKSRFGAVILSHDFLERNWPLYELDALLCREMSGSGKVVLPVRHNLDMEYMKKVLPSLSMRQNRNTADGLEKIAKEITGLVKRSQ